MWSENIRFWECKPAGFHVFGFSRLRKRATPGFWAEALRGPTSVHLLHQLKNFGVHRVLHHFDTSAAPVCTGGAPPCTEVRGREMLPYDPLLEPPTCESCLPEASSPALFAPYPC